MATKEMTIAILNRIEQLESERAALAAFVSSLRDVLRQQPDWKEIAANDKTLETVQARNASLRQSVLHATDGSSAASALVEGLMEHWS